MEPKTVNIIGRGIGASDAPKITGEDEQNWGVNIVIMRQPVDVGFDMHDEFKMNTAQINRRREIIPYAKAADIPVYSVRAISGSTYIRYPIKDIVSRFKTGFFSNTICYMMALALYKGVEQINLYGVVHLKYHKEYYEQKPGVDYWLGVAKGMGVPTYINGDYCGIGRTLDDLTYGYKITSDEMIKQYWHHP